MTRALRDWFRTATDIRREEVLPAGLMFAYGFLVLTSYYVAKAVRNATFVERVGADNLPYVYILTAVLVALVMVFYSRWVDRVGEMTLLQGTFAFMVVALVFFWRAMHGEPSVVTSGSFYIFVKLYGLLVVSQFWLVGNLLFTTRQAKRLFGPIGVGLILGAIAGGAITDQAVRTVGTENLLLAAAGILVLCSGVVWLLGPRMREGEQGSARLMDEISADAVNLLRESSHLRTIAWILGLTIVVSTMIDWELNKAVELYIQGEDAMTAFWGQFFALQNTASVLIQLLLTAFVLRKFGVGVALLALPAGLAVASVGVLALPVLLTAALAKGTEGALRYSLDQSTRELLYLPVPSAVKYKAKPLIDLAVYRSATGIGGVILLIATGLLGLSLRGVAVLCLVGIGAWVWFALRMKGEFRDSVRELIGVRDIRVDELIYRQLDASTLEELRHALGSDDEATVEYALALLEHDPPEGFADDLVELLDHESGEVRARAVSLLHRIGAADRMEEVDRLLDDPSLEVRAEAIHYVCTLCADRPAERMERFLREDEEKVREAALACLLKYGDEDQVQRALTTVQRLARDDDPAVRRTAAELLGEREEPPPDACALLDELVRDEAPTVRHAAMRSAGRARAQELVPLLLERMERREDRQPARRALAAYGSGIHDLLLERLSSEETPIVVRRDLAALFHEDATQATVDGLLAAIPELADPSVRYEAVKTLNKLRRDRGDLIFDAGRIAPLVRREVREGYAWCAAVAEVDARGGGEPLLVRTLRQRHQEAIERATRLLGLEFPLEDLYASFAALTSDERVMKDRGYELLENVLPLRYRSWFSPLADPDSGYRHRARAAHERFDVPRRGRDEWLEELAGSDDFWVALLARRDLGGTEPTDAASEELVREHLASDTLLSHERFEREGELQIMDIVEKAEFLKDTDLFTKLRTEDLAGLAALMEEIHFAPGEEVFPEGTTGCCLYVVVEGRIEARRHGREVFDAEEGQTVGDLAMLDGLPTRYEAVATEETTLLRLQREDFFSLLEERFRIARNMLAHMAGVVRRSDERREELLQAAESA